MANLYEQIDKYRNLMGIRSIKQLTDITGVPYGCIGELKRGRTKSLSMKNAQKLADFFGISVDELYGNESISSEIKKEPPIMDSSNEKRTRIILMVNELPPEAYDKLEEYIDLLNIKYN